MNSGEFDKYLTGRYEDQTNWYDRKSQKYKKLYYAFQGPIIILAAITPILIALGESWERWSAVIISALVAIGTTFLKTFKYQETWINYRTTCETLKKEIYFYNWELGEYANFSDKKQLFVERVESLLSRENTMWLTAHTSKKDVGSNDSTSGKRK